MSEILKKIRLKYQAIPIQAKASLWFLICSFLQRGISVITTPIFTRLLSTEEYGIYNTWNSWYGIATIVVGLSLTSGVHTQGLVKFGEERKEFTASLEGLMTTSVIIWLALAIVFNKSISSIMLLPDTLIYTMLLMVWTTSNFIFWANEQRVNYSYKSLVLITLIVSIVKPLAGIYAVKQFQGKAAARIVSLFFVEFVFYSWIFFKQLKNAKLLFSKKFWLYALRFNLPLLPHYLSQTLLNSVDRIMIQRIIGNSEAGIYGLAYSIALLMTLFNSSMMQTISPWIYQKIKNKEEKEIAPVAYSTLILVAIVNLLLILIAPEVLRIFAPPPYWQAIACIPPITMSVYFMYSYDLFAKFAFYFEKTRFVMLASLVGAVINVILNYLLLERYGYISAAYTTLLCYAIYSFMHYYFMKKICKDYYDGYCPYDDKVIFGITILFLLIGFSFMFTYNYPLIRYGIMLVIILIVLIKRQLIIEKIKGILSLKNNR